MELTKEKLLANDGELAYELATKGDQAFADSEFAQDYDIVSQQGGKVAYWLAWCSEYTGWLTYDYRILKLDKGGVAYWLAKHSDKIGWNTDSECILALHRGDVRRLLKRNTSLMYNVMDDMIDIASRRGRQWK